MSPTPRARLGELFARVDAFFERAAARFPGPSGITCHAGCADCCRRRFSVTAVEAEVIAEGLASLPAGAREALARRVTSGDPGVCPALGEDGRCGIYAFRPVICRTHGLPIRFAAEPAGDHDGDDRRAPAPAVRMRLPVVDACPRNFGGADLAALPGDAVLDQTTVSTVLGAIDAARAVEAGRPRGERIGLEALLAHAQAP